MAEFKLPRLLATAKEFNVGQDTIIDFLLGKGFAKDDLKPTSKLTEEMYLALQQEFQSDKVAKMKSDQVDLPKGGITEVKKKKEELEITFKKEENPFTKTKKEAAEPIAEEKPEIVKPVKEITAKEKLPKEEPVKEEIVKIEAPELEKLKVFLQ